MTPDQSIDHACQLQANAGPFGVNAAPECNQRLRFPMVIMHRPARVPRTCISKATTSLATIAQHALPAPELLGVPLPSSRRRPTSKPQPEKISAAEATSEAIPFTLD